MTTPRVRIRGGFNRPIQLSTWIRDYLSDGHITWAQQLYGDYRAELDKYPIVPYHRKVGRPPAPRKRRGMSRSGFLTYLYVMRRLNLIEYVDEPPDVYMQGGPRDVEDKPILAPRKFFRIVQSNIGSSAWQNIWDAYEDIK